MTHSPRGVHRSVVPMLLLGLGLALACPDLALASDIELFGGRGGEYFREPCPPGFYLVGVDGQYGGWVNRIAPVCAPWLRGSQTFGAPRVGPSHGTSTGPTQKQILCWGFGINNRAVKSWKVARNHTDRRSDVFVHAIQADCMALAPPVAKGRWSFGTPEERDEQVFYSPSLEPPLYIDAVCPAGELAVGIHGRAGVFVDAIGLICGPIPARVGAPATKVNPRAEMPPRAVTKVNPLVAAPPSAATQVNPLAVAPETPATSVNPLAKEPVPNVSVTPPPVPPLPQMNRSPFMFGTRGVEGKEAGRETAQPNEPAKKP